MAAFDDLKANVAALQAEDGVVLAAIEELRARVAAGATVSEADLQALSDQVKGEVDKLAASVPPAAPPVDEGAPEVPTEPVVGSPDAPDGANV